MNITKGRIAGGIAIGLWTVGAIAATALTFGSVANAAIVEPNAEPAVSVVDTRNGLAAEDEAEAAAAVEAARVEAVRIEAERVAAEAAAAEAARVEAERVAAEQVRVVAPAPPVSLPSAPNPPAPALTKCPAGTVPNAVDGAGNESNCQAGDYTGGVVVP